jgi:hypothetical protein
VRTVGWMWKNMTGLNFENGGTGGGRGYVAMDVASRLWVFVTVDVWKLICLGRSVRTRLTAQSSLTDIDDPLCSI